MGTKLGIIGLPNIGKSTLFNCLTHGKAPVAPYPFTTTDRNVGVAQVEDPRLIQLAQLIPHEQAIPTSIEFVDIAGLVRGAHRGEGLGNQFLSHVFAVDALLHVVRSFEDPNVPHVLGSIDPLRDIEIVNTELFLKDLEIIERRLEKEQKLAKAQDKQAKAAVEKLQNWQQALEQARPIRKLALAASEHPRALGIDLLSSKPVIYVANLDEASLENPSGLLAQLRQFAKQDNAGLLELCVKLEAELTELDPADRAAMMSELGLSRSALPDVVQQSYQLLGLATFFTTASQILQAWTVVKGARAPQAAGVIHTDFERHFIRAEVVSVNDLIACGGEAQARVKGLLRLEGKDYVVQDGDVIHFRVGQ